MRSESSNSLQFKVRASDSKDGCTNSLFNAVFKWLLSIGLCPTVGIRRTSSTLHHAPETVLMHSSFAIKLRICATRGFQKTSVTSETLGRKEISLSFNIGFL